MSKPLSAANWFRNSPPQAAPSACSVELTSRQVIERKLLAALDDEDKVALLCSRQDLDMLIAALHTSSIDGPKEREWERDLRQLRAEAFPPNMKGQP